MVCASPDYVEKAGTPESINALNQHKLVGMRSNPSQRVYAWEFSKSISRDTQRLEVTPAIIVNDPEALALAVANGAGIGQLGSNLALPLLAEGKAVHLFSEQTIQSRGIYAVYPTKRYAPLKLTSFIEHLSAALADRPDLVLGR